MSGFAFFSEGEPGRLLGVLVTKSLKNGQSKGNRQAGETPSRTKAHALSSAKRGSP